MQYLCLIYEDEKAWVNATQAEMEKGMAEYNAFTENIKKNGSGSSGACPGTDEMGPRLSPGCDRGGAAAGVGSRVTQP